MIQPLTSPRPRPFSSEEYHALSEFGFFEGERVELIGGEILEMSPQNSLHSATLTLVDDMLRRVQSEDRFVRVQLPLSLGDGNEPEPDISVVAGTRNDYFTQQPTTALLVVEVSESSLSFDRTVKSQLYASAKIPEFWIINVVDKVVEIYRSPNGLPFETGLAKYEVITVARQNDPLTPHFAPDAKLSVAEIFPR